MKDATKLLEDQQQEEKAGYKAEFQHLSNVGGQAREEEKKKTTDEDIDAYNDDFDEDIEEDLPEDNHLLESNENVQPNKNITESVGGVTVSQSLGVDPSVDSLALDDYDHVEPVERLS